MQRLIVRETWMERLSGEHENKWVDKWRRGRPRSEREREGERETHRVEATVVLSVERIPQLLRGGRPDCRAAYHA